MTNAEATLKVLTDRINGFEAWERNEIWDLVAKLRQVTDHYKSSAKVALMVVAMQIAVGRGQ